MSDQNAEIELLTQKLQEKDDILQGLMKVETHLIPLPNGDLHRGLKNRPVNANIDTEVIPESMGNPLDRAMSKILSAAKGGHDLTCLWCGLQFGSNSEKQIREHLKNDHPSVVDGWKMVETQVLMANLQEANERLEAATKAE